MHVHARYTTANKHTHLFMVTHAHGLGIMRLSGRHTFYESTLPGVSHHAQSGAESNAHKHRLLHDLLAGPNKQKAHAYAAHSYEASQQCHALPDA